MSIPPKPHDVKIFDKLPEANADTFSHALPLQADPNQLKAVVFYAPDLQAIGSIDNTTSKATTTYSQSVTSGFTFSTTQTISVEVAVEVNVEVVKASLTVGFSLSFTEQWSKSTTTTIQFSLPPEKKAFTYQGYMFSAIITYNNQTGAYAYGEKARFVTPILATSTEPLKGQASFRQL